MSDGPKRRWFQFHLSTAIALVLITGGLTGANLTDRMHYPRYVIRDGETYQIRTKNDAVNFEGVVEQRGWPLIANEIVAEWGDAVLNEEIMSPPIASRWNRTAVLVNFFVAIGFLLIVAFVAEFLVRRRENRKI